MRVQLVISHATSLPVLNADEKSDANVVDVSLYITMFSNKYVIAGQVEH